LVLGAFVVAASLAVLRAVRRLAAVILLGAVGYSLAGLFILFGAPDVALTLILVETVIVAVFAFVLNRLPRRFEQRRWGVAGALRIGVSLAVGGFVAAAALVTTGIRSSSPVSGEYTELAPAAGGRNVVNVILTDFRALDTLGEIAVIGVAAVGVGALVVRRTGHRRRNHARHGSAREAA
jgi:multicomponent Na+:H+ antiporter subunit A